MITTHLPGHLGQGGKQLQAVSGLRGVQSEMHSSWPRHSNVSVGKVTTLNLGQVTSSGSSLKCTL